MFDHLGSTKLLTDNEGRIVWPRMNGAPNELLPFGRDLDFDPDMQNPDEASYRLTFTNKEIDHNLGLHYFGARYYDATATRFISLDPVKGSTDNPLSWNPYLYCRNDPVNMIDPDGKWARNVTYSQAWVRKQEEQMLMSLIMCENIYEMIGLAIAWHKGNGIYDYKMQHDYENILGPGVGDINNLMHPKGGPMDVAYFDVPGFGRLDPAEYGNYRAGWTAGVIAALTGTPMYSVLVLAGILDAIFLRDDEDAAVDESCWDELSKPFYDRGFAAGMNHDGVEVWENRARIYFSGQRISVPSDALKNDPYTFGSNRD